MLSVKKVCAKPMEGEVKPERSAKELFSCNEKDVLEEERSPREMQEWECSAYLWAMPANEG